MTIQRKLLLVTLLAALLPQMAAAQSEPKAHQHGEMMDSGEATKPERCQEMMARHPEMLEKMKAKDAELGRLLEEMRAATGDAKVAATAAVVEELVAQHRSMHSMMRKHQPMMMHQMMGGMGEDGGMADCSCPMMQQMKPDTGEKLAPEDDHSEHDH